MSDGPYRSLEMRKCWKQLAERAELEASSESELLELYERALMSDFSSIALLKDLVRGIVEDRDSQGSLFTDVEGRLEDLRQGRSGTRPLAQLFLDCAIDENRRSAEGSRSIKNVVDCALYEWARRAALQVEEHYLRKGSRRECINMRERLAVMLNKADTGRLSKAIAKSKGPMVLNERSRQSDIDDGVGI